MSALQLAVTAGNGCSFLAIAVVQHGIKVEPVSEITCFMNPEFITSPQEALCHLFFHCCFKDGRMTSSEIEVVSEKLVAAALNRDLNFKEEILRYRSYQNKINDETAYLENLVAHIRPVNKLALFSFCIELCLSDGLLQAVEETLLHALGETLHIDAETQETCIKLIVQRKVVETEKVF